MRQRRALDAVFFPANKAIPRIRDSIELGDGAFKMDASAFHGAARFRLRGGDNCGSMVALGLIGVSVVLVVLEYLLDFLEGFAADFHEVLDGFGFPDFNDSRDGDRIDEFSYTGRGRGYYRHAQCRNKGSL